jgi:hypothetical protein
VLAGSRPPSVHMTSSQSLQCTPRRERPGDGDGRVYLVSFTATDTASGASSSGKLQVCVPTKKGKAGMCVDSDSDTTRSSSAPGEQSGECLPADLFQVCCLSAKLAFGDGKLPPAWAASFDR